MTEPLLSPRPLRQGANYPSPFTRLLGLGYQDGPTSGLVQQGQDGPEYRFDRVEELWNQEGLDLRIFTLATLPSPSLSRLTEAYSRYLTPHWPLWVPVWRFPTPADQEAMERLTDQVLQQAGPVKWVIAAYDLLGEIVAARVVTTAEVSQVTDWLSFLDLTTNTAGEKG